ncbi:MAG: NADH-quinone oxidoreductase subunit NuoH [Candidatus Nitrohelix vancouverensis]|uniref:NADH-quinone oxidoreductase subunit H n=1 Tax=Candidatus Nitrohelix vancouverensis TaxID=2705534 RepID=A0A7T0C4Y8_9BACT|nr:MAG: NADH-quinone oxidoreductase subunit NuoH [Candidatus Nitrohelix vancouverensis]
MIDSLLTFLDENTYLLLGAVKAVIIAAALLGVVPALVWLERRLMGRFQVRLGPNRVGPMGLGQPISDSIKLLFKESIIQSSADKFLFHLAPAIVVFTAIVAFAAIPLTGPFELFGEQIGLWVANINSGILFVFAISGMGIYGMVLAGLSSNNKYSLMGGLRSTAQMISYELTLGLAALCVIVHTGSLNLVDMVDRQSVVPNIINLFNPPLILAFFLFFIAGVAETNRAPFDLPEAEQELVAGFHTEYTGMKFAMFFMGEYINMVTMSALITILFLGGWNAYILPDGPIIGFLAFAGKVLFLLCVFIWLRSTFPRIRYDRLMTFGWKFLLPIAVLNLLFQAALKVL